MKPIALISGPFFHHLDHLGPLSHFLNCPLLVDDKETYRLGKQYYPEIDIHYDFVDLRKIANHYDTIILSTKYAKQELGNAYHAMNIHHMRFCYCPHGQSDKGLSDPSMIPETNQDIILFYGETQKKRLNREGPIIGNFRLAYYEKFRGKLDTFTLQELASFPKQKTILYAPTWNDQETATTFFKTWKELIDRLPDSYNLIIKLHPLLEKHYPAETHTALSFNHCKPNVRILFEFPLIYPLLNRTDIYLGDYSAVGYDFLYFNRPLFFLGAKPVPLHACGTRVHSVSHFFQNLTDAQHHLNEQRTHVYNETFTSFSSSIFSKSLK